MKSPRLPLQHSSVTFGISRKFSLPSAFFDDDVTTEEKQLMLEALQEVEGSNETLK